ncbi:hypothetical protein IWQ56_000242 [Coemansia nantahalensis]|uniref:Uncharacterized protein n=1 Tax=Coemansia nantahalensis TaxID=2789366 RepID=A0ACC1JMV6_9FUNG|nr:hypothetical protein IWQ57_005515 [Coemansia nantahalensis]KAJ2775128.1 hypothetical protein IWQ56_000242 [Coemansia nantahalensis]
MGASNSKEEPIHIYGGEVPIGFTVQLKDKLEKEAATQQRQQKQQQKQQQQQKQNQEQQQIQQQRLADAVEQEVARELARILEKSQLEELKAKEHQASTAELLGEIRDVARQIGSGGGQSRRPESFGDAVAARDRVAACLRQHEGRALDCWKEVGEFKALVSALEREAVGTSSQ